MFSLPTFPQNPLQAPLDKVSRWFKVDEQRLQELLHQIRAELPTTQALLIGKPQAGKSSIVRGLTGISADMIGQGFRPHTRHTQRYAYPTNELPLLIFTDTVGLGDGAQQISEVIQELLNDLESPPRTGEHPTPPTNSTTRDRPPAPISTTRDRPPAPNSSSPPN
ncbi:MAG: GTPase, partial [Synechococcales bacterium]|nr:GTPase [Synechococcales bacterium]